MDAPEIQYAPVKRGERRRRIIRRATQVVVLFVMIPVLLKCGGLAWRRGQLVYWQQRALNHEAPPARIVFDSSNGGSYVPAKEWRRFTEILSPPGRIPHATLFLHEVKDAKGDSYLIAIECGYSPVGFGPPGLWLFSTVVKPGSLFEEPRELGQGMGPVLIDSSELNAGTPYSFSAGQVDPKDHTHFTIDFTVGKKAMVIDGWLLEDDRVDISIHTKR